MRRHAVVTIALIGSAAVGIAAQTLELGIVERVPPAVSVQLTLAQQPEEPRGKKTQRMIYFRPFSLSSQNRKPARLRFSITFSLSLRMNSDV